MQAIKLCEMIMIGNKTKADSKTYRTPFTSVSVCGSWSFKMLVSEPKYVCVRLPLNLR